MSDIFSTVKPDRNPFGSRGYVGVDIVVDGDGDGRVTTYSPEPADFRLTSDEVRGLRDYLTRTLEDNARAGRRR